MQKFNSFFFGFGFTAIYFIYKDLKATATQCDEYLTHRRANKLSIGQRNSSNAILRTNRKRSNECIAK